MICYCFGITLMLEALCFKLAKFVYFEIIFGQTCEFIKKVIHFKLYNKKHFLIININTLKNKIKTFDRN